MAAARVSTRVRQSAERTVDVVRLELRDARCTRRCKPRGRARKHVRTEVRARDRRCEPVDLDGFIGAFVGRRLLGRPNSNPELVL
jgi:hypothetical protein